MSTNIKHPLLTLNSCLFVFLLPLAYIQLSFLQPTLQFHLSGSFIISECSSDWSVVRRMGTQILLAANGLLHVCTNSSDEDQSMVRPNFCINHTFILFYHWKLKFCLLHKANCNVTNFDICFEPVCFLVFRWYFAVISMSGVFAVTFSVIFAYVADITQEHERSTAYGLVRKWLKQIGTVCDFP